MNLATLPAFIVFVVQIIHLRTGKCRKGLIAVTFVCESKSHKYTCTCEILNVIILFRFCIYPLRSAEKSHYFTIQGTASMFAHLLTSDSCHFEDYFSSLLGKFCPIYTRIYVLTRKWKRCYKLIVS